MCNQFQEYFFDSNISLEYWETKGEKINLTQRIWMILWSSFGCYENWIFFHICGLVPRWNSMTKIYKKRVL